jgi:hypothetical protein
MQPITYVMVLSHRETGVGVCAQQALRNSIGRSGSPVQRVEVHKRNSHETILHVTTNDPNRDYLRNAIERSGRMPAEAGMYRIESVQLYSADSSTEDASQLRTLEEQCHTLATERDALNQANARLQRVLADASTQKISSPLEAMLRYFHTLDYRFDTVVDEKIDKEFIQKVFKGNIENTVHAYYQYATGQTMAADDFVIACAFDVDAEKANLDTLLDLVSTARAELEYLEGIEGGHTSVPETLKEEICTMIMEKNHEETIQRYEYQISEFEELRATKERITNAKKYYYRISEVIELLQQESQPLPALFSQLNENTVEVYFPFIARKVKTGLLQDLHQDLQGVFPHCDVQQKPNDFLAYTISTKGKDSTSSLVEKMLEETPSMLLLAGYNTLTSYRLGI